VSRVLLAYTSNFTASDFGQALFILTKVIELISPDYFVLVCYCLV
jgi:hypothetical protein